MIFFIFGGGGALDCVSLLLGRLLMVGSIFSKRLRRFFGTFRRQAHPLKKLKHWFSRFLGITEYLTTYERAFSDIQNMTSNID